MNSAIAFDELVRLVNIHDQMVKIIANADLPLRLRQGADRERIECAKILERFGIRLI